MKAIVINNLKLKEHCNMWHCMCDYHEIPLTLAGQILLLFFIEFKQKDNFCCLLKHVPNPYVGQNCHLSVTCVLFKFRFISVVYKCTRKE